MVRQWSVFPLNGFLCFGWIWWEIQNLGIKHVVFITQQDKPNVHEYKPFFHKKQQHHNIPQTWPLPLQSCSYLLLFFLPLLHLARSSHTPFPQIPATTAQRPTRLSTQVYSCRSWRESEPISGRSTSLQSRQFRQFLVFNGVFYVNLVFSWWF